MESCESERNVLYAQLLEERGAACHTGGHLGGGPRITQPVYGEMKVLGKQGLFRLTV